MPGSSTTSLCLTKKLAELSKVTNGCFSFPISKRATTLVLRSRQSLVSHTFYSSLSFIMLLLFRHYDKKAGIPAN